MKILVSNDDGYRAPGIAALAAALSELAEVVVVAPERNRSGASNSLTLDRPLRITRAESGFYSVDGTPADCVYLAAREILGEKPDLVVSGINAGENLGDDVLYSGTVAAAMEGGFLGCPALAVSLAGSEHRHFDTAATVAVKLVRQILRAAGLNRWLLNVNVPDCPYDELNGVRVTRLGQRHKESECVRQNDPKGRPIFWIGPSGPPGADAGPGTDFHAVENGFVSVTPLQTDLTAYAMLEQVTDWVSAIPHS